MAHLVITIGCEYGAKGNMIGRKVAKDLGIKFYDRDTVDKIIKEVGIPKDIMEKVEEGGTIAGKGAEGDVRGSFSKYADLTQRAIHVQKTIIRKLADRESCVIIGRSADYILKEQKPILRIFIYSPEDVRIENVMKSHNFSAEDAKLFITEKDKRYHKRHLALTGSNRGDRHNRDMLIDSSLLGVDGTAELIEEVAKKVFHEQEGQDMNKKESEFNKVFSAWDILVIAFGAMIGWGWVVSTGNWIEKGGVLGAALGFCLGGVMIFFVGLTYAELTAAMPQCGGEHVFSHRAMGPTGSFICTWAIVLGYVSVACFEACAFPTIITYLWPGFLKGYLYTVAGFDVYASWLAVAIIVAFLIMMINIMGAKTAAILQTVLTCIIGGAGILLIVASVINGTVDNLDGQMFVGNTAGLNIKAILGVAAMSPFYFIGFDVIPQAAEEINVPPKKIGKMLILSVILAVVFYALVIIAVGLVLDSGAIIKSQEATGLVTADAMGTAFGMKIMAKVVIVGGMCGIITSWNSFLIGGSRAMYSMAESYMIPKTFAKLHPKHKTPINALILIGVLTMLAPFAGRQLLVWISDAGNFACCLAYCMVAVSFMILRKKEPDMPRPYKVPAYKFFGTMAVIMSGFMVCMYCIPGSGGSLILPEWGMVGAWSLLGVVFYVVCKRKYKESFGDLVELISDEDAATLMPEADDEELDKVIDAAIDRVLASIQDDRRNRENRILASVTLVVAGKGSYKSSFLK